MEMAHSVEGRLPLLDHEVVALVAQMPIAMQVNGMTEKFVLREAARPVLTDNVYRRQKHPFLSPPSTLQTKGGLHSLITTPPALRRTSRRETLPPLVPANGSSGVPSARRSRV
jgi:asparagine synthetase B (glutamine-hydrolysing)